LIALLALGAYGTIALCSSNINEADYVLSRETYYCYCKSLFVRVLRLASAVRARKSLVRGYCLSRSYFSKEPAFNSRGARFFIQQALKKRLFVTEGAE
jgi:hypothetical protein